MKLSLDEKWMRYVLKLAKRGAGFVSPNPLVGCVMVKKGKIIAEGYHRKYGGEHAEQAALAECRMQNAECRNATVYVNLEPCCHYGQTPPCADALIAAGVKRVVMGMKDPNPLVAGKSIKKLRRAGIEVEAGILRAECEELNEPFTKWITTGRPFVLIKVAITLDGALTLKKGTETSLGSLETMRRVHQLRQQYDAIVVGVNTVLIDDPRLTCRGVTPSLPRRQAGSPPHFGKLSAGSNRGRIKCAKNPVRVVFDTNLRIPENARLLRESGETIIFTGLKVNQVKQKRILKGRTIIPSSYEEGCPAMRGGVVEIVPMSLDKDNHVSLKAAFKWLGEHNVMSVMVEGGAELASSLLKQKLVDKMILIMTPHLASDPAAPRLYPALSSLPLLRPHCELVGSDAWLIGYLN